MFEQKKHRALQKEEMGKRFVDPDAIVSYMNLLSVNLSSIVFPGKLT